MSVDGVQRVAFASSLVLLAGLTISGCVRDQVVPSPHAAGPPDVVSTFSNFWSADAGIDLMSRGAELVRATFEASVLDEVVGIDDTDRAYPGFRNAANQGMWNDTVMLPSVGKLSIFPSTSDNNIIEYSATNTKVDAVVCSYKIAVDPVVGPGSYASSDGHPGAIVIDSDVISLVNSAGSPGLPGLPANNHDDSDWRLHRVPNWNVFGSWNVARVVPGNNNDNIRAACMRWAHAQFPQAAAEPAYSWALPMPTSTPLPHHPVAPQYPEWVGPAKS